MNTPLKVVVIVLAVIGALAVIGVGGMALMHFMMGGSCCQVPQRSFDEP